MTDVGTLDGGWFAFTPGGDPRDADDQIAIFYMDFVTGRVSSYRYDGAMAQGFYSWQDPDLFITSWADAVETTIADGVLTFDITDLDIAAVQAASDADGYTGAAFGRQIGIWMHLTVMRDPIQFDEDGRLSSFSTGPLASLDLPRTAASPVPLPGAALFALTGAVGLVAARRARG